MDLIDFLRARLEEKEKRAQALAEVRSMLDDPRRVIDLNVRSGAEYVFQRAQLNPAEMLADVAAKRRIIEEIAPKVEGYDDQITNEWGGPNDGTADKLLALLALPDADHPDCRAEWAPD